MSTSSRATITAAVNGMRDRLIAELKTATTVVDAETMVSDDQNAFALGQGTGSDISQAKSQWVNRLYSTLTSADQTINGYHNLTADQLSERLNALQTAVTTANDQVQGTTTWSATTDILTNFVNTTVPAITLKADQEDAVNQLQATLATTKATIEADPTLSTDDKKNQNAAADAAFKTAQDQVNDVSTTTTTDVADKLKTGNDNITGTHKSLTPINGKGGRVDQFKGDITNASDPVRQQVEAASQAGTITADQKQSLDQAIDQAVATAQAAADKAQNADDINNAQAVLDVDLTKVQYDLATDIENHNIKVAQANTLQAIADDKTLSGQEKADQTAKVNQAVTDSAKTLSDATTPAAVTSAGQGIVAQINGLHTTSTPVSDRLPAFIKQVTEAAQALVAQAKAQGALSQTGLATMTAAINGMRDRMIAELKTADSVVGAETMVSDDQNALGLGQGNESALSQAKSQWVNRLYSTLTSADQTLNGYHYLTTDQLNDRLNDLQAAVTSANAQVQATNNWTDTANILQTFVNTTVPAITLQADKEDAVNQMKDTLATTKSAIEADPTLSTADKNSQSANADGAFTAAEGKVNTATTTSDVADQMKTGNDNITKTHQAQTPITGKGGRVDQFKGNITDSSAAVRAQVTAASQAGTITADQQDSLNQAIDQAVATAQAAADKAQNADDINTAKATLDQSLTKVQTDLAKDVESHNIKAAQAAALQTIADDKTLSGQEKADQSAAVNKLADDGQSALTSESTADAVTANGQKTVDAIKNLPKNGQPVSDRLPNFEDQIRAAAQGLVAKATSHTDLSQTGLATVTSAINGMRDRLIAELKTADSVVAAETMVSDDQNAFALGQGTGSDLSQAKSQWVNRLYITLIGADQTLNGYHNLTTDQLNERLAALQTAVTETNTAVQATNNWADTVNLLKTFVDSTVPAITLKADQEDAVNQLKATLTTTKSAIEADPTLSTADKDSQSTAADGAFTTAEGKVNDATTTDDVAGEMKIGNDNITKTHKPQTPINGEGGRVDQFKGAITNESDKVRAQVEAASQAGTITA
ncbi:DUF1542 domain-containing protein, partial [Fructobacillus ficulneus]|uniref:DUF1542 domain-containing protein n=1 Tax=Fructobacillus ficulneus TaxID=157463 RepID=UPI000ADF349A